MAKNLLRELLLYRIGWNTAYYGFSWVASRKNWRLMYEYTNLEQFMKLWAWPWNLRPKPAQPEAQKGLIGLPHPRPMHQVNSHELLQIVISLPHNRLPILTRDLSSLQINSRHYHPNLVHGMLSDKHDWVKACASDAMWNLNQAIGVSLLLSLLKIPEDDSPEHRDADGNPDGNAAVADIAGINFHAILGNSIGSTIKIAREN